ncbi:MAG TPA: VIT1/CCC1 transporter family protein [Thermoplasmata archaeon]|nr:VIT1/CCC1 transporter family protein [Thermoplasmata archaeon]
MVSAHIDLAHEPHPRPTLLSDFILGSQDGLVNVLGIVLGLTAAGTGSKVILIASLAALAAESISMGAVAYTSTLSRRNLYVSELARETQEMRDVPEMEREEVRVVLREWGYEGEEVETMLRMIEAKPKAWLDIMMAFELNLAEVRPEQPRNSGLIVLGATVVGSILPLVPLLAGIRPPTEAAIVAVILSGIGLAVIGWYEARVTMGSIWVNAPRMMLIGLGAGLAGFLVGHFLGVA